MNRLQGSRSRLAHQPAPDTAWPAQLHHTWRSRQRCRAPLSRRQASSNLGIGALDSGDEQPRPSPVNYAPKDRKQLWKAAIKLPMYSVGVVPVLVGAAAAYLEHSMMPWARVAALLVGSICVIAWLNLRWVFTARTLVVSPLPRSLLSHQKHVRLCCCTVVALQHVRPCCALLSAAMMPSMPLLVWMCTRLSQSST